MSREFEGYRDTLALLSERFPTRTALTITEVAEVLGVHPQTVVAAINRKKNPLPAQNISAGSKNKKYVISIPALARWQCGGAHI